MIKVTHDEFIERDNKVVDVQQGGKVVIILRRYLADLK